MKKKLLFTCLIGLISVTSAYAACDGGTEVTNTAGTTFCKSNVVMNWWSAAAWCKANKMQLATMYEMCPSWDGGGGCSELSGVGRGTVWSATVLRNDLAFAVGLHDGIVNDSYFSEGRYGRNNVNASSAFCK